jgi:hypothetical protein
MVDELKTVVGNVVGLPFTLANLTTGESNSDMKTAGSIAGTVHIMPKAGSIVAIAAGSAASITAGTITLRAHSNSTEQATEGYPAPVLSSAAQQSYATVRARAIRFAAGDKLGVSLTTTTTLDPTNTLDVDAVLYVQFDND